MADAEPRWWACEDCDTCAESPDEAVEQYLDTFGLDEESDPLSHLDDTLTLRGYAVGDGNLILVRTEQVIVREWIKKNRPEWLDGE